MGEKNHYNGGNSHSSTERREKVGFSLFLKSQHYLHPIAFYLKSLKPLFIASRIRRITSFPHIQVHLKYTSLSFFFLSLHSSGVAEI